MVNPSMTEQAANPQFVSAAEWLRRNPGIFGKDTFYLRLKDGSIPCIKAGKKRLVPVDLLDRVFANDLQAQK